MMIGNNAAFYPASFAPRPYATMANNFTIKRPVIPPYFNQVIQQKVQQHSKNEIPSSFKLYDLDTNNHSEIIRLIFSYVGIPYKDKRLKQDEWIQIKDQMSFEQLPILTINNKFKIFHLHAIIRYIAREFHLYGTGKHDQAIVDIILETTRQFQEKMNNEQTIRQFITDHATAYLKQLEKFYEIFKRQGPFYLGSHISLADLIVYVTINDLINIDPKLLDNYSHLKEARRLLEKHPKVLNYINNKTKQPIKTLKSKSPTPNINPPQDQQRSDEEDKSKHHHHHHHHHCPHHRRHSKEQTPSSQTKKRSIRSSKSPSILTNNHESAPLRTTIIIPPPPPVSTEQKSAFFVH